MSNLSLRLPYLIYLSIGSMMVGVLIAPLFRDIPPDPGLLTPGMAAAPRMMEGTHTMRDVPSDDAPTVSMTVARDPVAGWNVTLVTENFTFAPDRAGGEHVPGTGHAHLYVNGIKVARVYGRHVHIPDLAPGEHLVRVSLSGNDHAYYSRDGTPIEARAVVFQGDPPIEDG